VARKCGRLVPSAGDSVVISPLLRHSLAPGSGAETTPWCVLRDPRLGPARAFKSRCQGGTPPSTPQRALAVKSSGSGGPGGPVGLAEAMKPSPASQGLTGNDVTHAGSAFDIRDAAAGTFGARRRRHRPEKCARALPAVQLGPDPADRYCRRRHRGWDRGLHHRYQRSDDGGGRSRSGCRLDGGIPTARADHTRRTGSGPLQWCAPRPSGFLGDN
jgi:hypothetical protein